MYKIILIDLDDTIFDFKSGEKNALKESFDKYSLEFNENIYNEFSKINEYYFQEYSKDVMTREEFHFNRFSKILKYLKSDINPVEINKLYMDNLSLQCEFVSGAYELISELSKNYILCVASNGKYDVQIKRLKKASIYDFFDNIYVSSKIGFNKPNEKFFEAIFNDYPNYSKNNFVIIGDRLDSDIIGGINSGIDTIWFNKDNKISNIKPKYSFNTLDEIRRKMAK